MRYIFYKNRPQAVLESSNIYKKTKKFSSPEGLGK